MSKYICTACNKDDEAPCVLEVVKGCDSPVSCPFPYNMDDKADWKRVALPQALESEELIQNYTLQARMITIETKSDVNDAIHYLENCIVDLIGIDWPEDIEMKSRLGVTA